MSDRGRPRHPDVLTPREWDVLTLVREGMTNQEAGERLGISRDAVKYHVSEILGKLQLQSREEAAAWRPEPAPQPGLFRPIWASALGPIGTFLGQLPLIGRVALVGTAGTAVAGVVALGTIIGLSELSGDDVSEGEETVALVLGEPDVLEPTSAIVLETGCFQCDGGMTGLVRVWTDLDGEHHMDRLFGSAPAEILEKYPVEHDYTPAGLTNTEPMNAAVSARGTYMAVAYCTSGQCGLSGAGAAGPDAEVTVYLSANGGVTWDPIRRYETAVLVEMALPDGRVVLSMPGANGGTEFRILPGDEVVTPPPGSAIGYSKVVQLSDGEVGWADDTGRIADAAGNVVFDLSPAGVENHLISFAPMSAEFGHAGVLLWQETPADAEKHITVFRGDSVKTLQASEPYHLVDSISSASAGTFLGNISVTADDLGLPPGSVPLDTLPVRFDEIFGLMRPIVEPFTDPSYPPDRYTVRGVLDGRFARVTDTGSCLPIRRRPTMDEADVLRCLPDGVLLTASSSLDSPDLVLDDPEAWRSVSYGSQFGFAEARFIED